MEALLSTKLHIPTPRTSLVRRQRLIDTLDAALLENRRLILVSAPAGFGKTTLLAGWVASLAPNVARAAWLSLDERDADPARFLAYLVAALQRAVPGLGADLLDALRAPQPPPADTLLTALVNELAAGSAPHVVLVLDDYHAIKAPPVHAALTFLLDAAPPQLHLVVAGRSDPPLPIATLRGRGQLAELRAADLRFTLDEAAAFAVDVMGLSLPPAAVATLEARTEGWITGLQLAALSLRRHDPADVPAFLAALAGTNRYILDYLVEQVLAREPEPVQAFLLHTSILDRLCADLCDALLPPSPPLPLPPSPSLLEYLDTSNLFLIPLDDERRWYRYHRLFADLLRARLDAEQALALHKRASAWFEGNGYIAEAVDHALKGEDVQRAARLVEQVGMDMLTRGEVATLLGWLGALPEPAVCARPRLCIVHAWALVLAGQVAAADTRLADAGAPPGGPGETSLPRELLGHAAAIRGYGAAIKGQTAQAVVEAHRALDLLPQEEGIVRSVVAFTLGGVHLLHDDVAAAADAFARAVDIGRRAANLHVVLPAARALAQLYRVQGRLHDAAGTYREALTLAEEAGAPRTPVVGSIYIGLSDLLREWNDLDAAEEQVRRGLALVEKWGNSDSLSGAHLALARLLQARGDLDGAAAAVDAARQALAGRVSNPLSDILVASYRQQLRIARGELQDRAVAAAAAVRWAGERELQPTGPVSYLHEPEYLALARLWLAAGQAEEAARLANHVATHARRAGRMGSSTEALLLRALALDAVGLPGVARETLDAAIALAAPQGYVRLFLDEGAGMVALLAALAPASSRQDYVNMLLAAAGSAARPTAHAQPLVEPLTDRELEVLALVAAGLTNRDIAERLVIEVSTVKSHTNSLYGKLGVKNRTQAVARARDLGLLE